MNHILESFRHHFRLQIATLLVLTASFTVVAGTLLVFSNIEKVLSLWGESLQVSAYLSETASQEQMSKIEKSLRTNVKVDKLQFISKDEALKQFRDQMASYAPDLLKDAELLKFVPNSFQFAISSLVDAKDQLSTIKEIANDLRLEPGVEEVNYGQDWVKSYSSVSSGLKSMGSIFLIVIIASAGFVMSNSIHSSIEQRRTEIEVLELVGATSRFIRVPFLIEGAFLGLTSGIIALSLTGISYQYLRDFMAKNASLVQLSQHVEFLKLDQAFGFMMLALTLGLLSAWLCIWRINNGWAAGSKLKES
jgi:cell division transport system permease protein